MLTIFIFGIFLGNGGDLLPNFMTKSINAEKTKKSLHEFHVLTSESTFLVRTFFFLFFGFSIFSASEFGGTQALGILISLTLFVARYLYLSFSTFSFNTAPLLYMSPRGLIKSGSLLLLKL